MEEFKDWEKAKERLGKGQYYNDWLLFYQREIERLGWQGTLSEYLFKGDERSEDMLIRMLAGKYYSARHASYFDVRSPRPRPTSLCLQTPLCPTHPGC